MRSSAPEAPRKGRQTLAQLRRLQREAGAVIMRPLDAEYQMQQKWTDGRDTQAFVSRFIKPNDRLTSFERIEIYNRQYWFRLIDCIYDDFPGLLAVLGKPRFNRMAIAYLSKYPSRSFSMRNLGSKLPEFLVERPELARPYTQMAQDMAKFEWAQTVAFDGPAGAAIVADDLLGRDPRRLRLGLQPYITLLDMAYPLDDFSLALKKKGYRSEASNAMSGEDHSAGSRKIRRPRRRRTFVAVHRLDNDLYFKRLEPAAYQLLMALAAGKTLAAACEGVADQATPRKIKQWFIGWTAAGWFCRRK
jgi:hypothetical protein